MTQGTWILERCVSDRFPYRLQIIKGENLWLVLRTQDRWPAAGRNIFCLREKEPPVAGEVLEEVERVPIIVFHERGRRLDTGACQYGAHILTNMLNCATTQMRIRAS